MAPSQLEESYYRITENSMIASTSALNLSNIVCAMPRLSKRGVSPSAYNKKVNRFVTPGVLF